MAAALAGTACSPAEEPRNRSAGAASNAISSSAGASPERAAPCTPEELSCGLQTPRLSDGVRPFRNPEMGIAAFFPEGSRVCIARSGNAARGFYAWFGTPTTGCPERGDIAATRMSVSGSFNALFHRSIRDAVGRCSPLSPAVLRALGGQAPAFHGHRSISCQQTGRDGSIEISVHALAGRRPGDSATEPAQVIYLAAIETRPDRLEPDLERFQTFLARLRIGSPG